MAAFTDVLSSVRCAIDIQRAFQQFNGANPRLPLHVRIGLNAGEPVERNDDLFGMTVQLAARVCSHCEPEQVLVSGIIFELCKGEYLGSAFSDIGKAHFKGFEHAIPALPDRLADSACRKRLLLKCSLAWDNHQTSFLSTSARNAQRPWTIGCAAGTTRFWVMTTGHGGVYGESS